MRPMLIATTAVWIVIGPGCTSSTTDLVRSGYVSLRVNEETSQKLQLGVYDNDGSLLVEGTVRARELTLETHLDVAIVAPSGELVGDAKVNFRRHASSNARVPGRSSARSTRTGAQHYHFSLRFPNLPPKGSIVSYSIDYSAHPPRSVRP